MTLHFINLYGFIEKNPIAQLCLHSWKTLMPELEIKIWTEKDEFIQKLLNEKNKLMDYWNIVKNNDTFGSTLDLGNICDYLRLNVQYEFGGLYAELDHILFEPIKIDENLEFCQQFKINANAQIYKSLAASMGPCYFKKYNPIVYSVIQNQKNYPPNILWCNEQSFCEIPYNKELIKGVLRLMSSSNMYPKIKMLHFSDWFNNYNIIIYDKADVKKENIGRPNFYYHFNNNSFYENFYIDTINNIWDVNIPKEFHNLFKIYLNILYKTSKKKNFTDYCSILNDKEYTSKDLINEWEKICKIN